MFHFVVYYIDKGYRGLKVEEQVLDRITFAIISLGGLTFLALPKKVSRGFKS